MMERRVKRLIQLTAALMVLLVALPCAGEQRRYHGFQLNDQYHLLIEEYPGGLCKIGLRARTRPVGGLEPEYTRMAGEAETGRLEEVQYLAEVRSQVVKPASPNYFQSRGEIYRIFVDSLGDTPEYHSRQEVFAADARRTVAEELRKIWVHTSGTDQSALYWSVPVVLSILKEADRMPAPLYTPVAESIGGGIRVKDPTLTRQSLPAGRDLSPYAGESRLETMPQHALAQEKMTAPAPGRPGERAGAVQYTPGVISSDRIKPRYIDPRVQKLSQERRGEKDLSEEEVSHR